MNIFTILGERCSGTNFLEKAIQANFNLDLTWNYGYKHFFGFSDYKNSDNVLFIGIVRDPIQWLLSLHKQPHHLIYLSDDFNSFITEEICSTIEEQEIMEDRNIYTKERYRNIFELREIKNKFLIDDMPNKVKNYILIKYEDLSSNYTKTLDKIQNTFNLNYKHDSIIEINEYYVGGAVIEDKKSADLHVLPIDFKEKVYNSLNIEMETKIGYNSLNK